MTKKHHFPADLCSACFMHQNAGATQAQEQICKDTLLGHLPQLEHGTVLVIGDIMLDAYLIGDAERISPEAPVPVVHVAEEKYVLGGAGNVARNVAELGGQSILIGTVGHDEAGKKLQGLLEQERISSHLCISPERSTIVKTRLLARQQQVVRFDRETKSVYSDALNAAIIKKVVAHLPQAGSVIISDYGKGCVTQSLVQVILETTERSGRTIPILIDPKPTNMKAYKGVTLLTPNAKEASEMAGEPVSELKNVPFAAKKIKESLKTEYMLMTLGAEGMALQLEDNTVWHIPTTAKRVFDVTGAGDTVIGTLGLALAAGVPLIDACMLSNYAAGVVVGEIGAAVATSQQMRRVISTLKMIAPQQLA